MTMCLLLSSVLSSSSSGLMGLLLYKCVKIKLVNQSGGPTGSVAPGETIKEKQSWELRALLPRSKFPFI